MKPLKKHYSYIYYLYLPLFLLAMALILLFPEQSLLCFRVHWLVLLFTLLLIITPIGNIRLGEKVSAIPLTKWLIIILLTSIAITFIYWGFSYICFNGLPVLLPDSSKNFIANTGPTFIITWGGYSWFVFLLIGIGLAYISYCQKQPGKYSLLSPILFKNKPDDATSLSVDFITRTIAHFSLATSIGIITILITALLAKLFQATLSVGLNYVTLLLATLLFVGINTPQWQKIVRNFAVKKIPLGLLVIGFVITSAVIILIGNYLLTMFIANFPQGNKTLLTFTIPHWETHWQLFSGMWWLSWTPLMGGLIAFLSKGYRIRTVILAGLLIFLINILILFGITQTNILLNGHWLFVNYLFPIIGFTIIIIIFMQKKYLTYQMRAIVPGTHIEKQRSILFYMQTLFQSAAFFIILYLPFGIYVTSIYVFIMVFPFAIVTTIICVALVKLFLKSK